MEPCDQPLSEMEFCQAVTCVWRKGVGSIESVISAPGSANIADWSIAILAALCVLAVLAFLLRALAPRSRVREHASTP